MVVAIKIHFQQVFDHRERFELSFSVVFFDVTTAAKGQEMEFGSERIRSVPFLHSSNRRLHSAGGPFQNRL